MSHSKCFRKLKTTANGKHFTLLKPRLFSWRYSLKALLDIPIFPRNFRNHSKCQRGDHPGTHTALWRALHTQRTVKVYHSCEISWRNRVCDEVVEEQKQKQQQKQLKQEAEGISSSLRKYQSRDGVPFSLTVPYGLAP